MKKYKHKLKEIDVSTIGSGCLASNEYELICICGFKVEEETHSIAIKKWNKHLEKKEIKQPQNCKFKIKCNHCNGDRMGNSCKGWDNE